MMNKNHKKALAKTITWKLISSTVFFLIVWLGGLDLSKAGTLTLIDFVVKTILMYGHELAWQGKMKG